MAKGKSRPERWMDAVAKAKTAAEAVQNLVQEWTDKFEEKKTELEEHVQSTLDQMKEDAETAIEEKKADIAEALEELNGLKEEYGEWKSNLPESLQSSPVGEKLDAIDSMDFDIEVEFDAEVAQDISASVESNIDDIIGTLDEAEGADLPRGFGKD